MWPNPQETEDLVTFTEKILNGKLHFLCSEIAWFLLVYLVSINTAKHQIEHYTKQFSVLVIYIQRSKYCKISEKLDTVLPYFWSEK